MNHKDLLIAWELGAGLGHATRLRPIVQRVMDKGRSAKCLAIRAKDAAGQLPCPVEPAPWLRAPRHDSAPWIGHLADTLAALGWDQPDHLREAVRRWREVLEREKPRTLVMDSAPVALLASQGLPMKRVWLANGWSTPPDTHPIPDLQERLLGQTRPVADTEPAVVEAINACLTDINQPPIAHLHELFGRVELNAMLAIPEIDPHGPRPGVTYHGVWGKQPGATPPWPPSRHGPDTPGVFVYLKPFPMRGAVLRLLAQSGLPTLAYTPAISEAETEAARGGAIHLFTQPIDWHAAAPGAAFIICHGSSGMTGQSMQMGLPVLAIPLSLEQLAVARQAERCGAVAVASPTDGGSIRAALHRMLIDESITKAADRCARAYAGIDPSAAAATLADRIIALGSNT